MAANTENTVLDFLSWRGDLSLQSSAFNEVDGVILARLSYLPFEYLGEAAQTGLRSAKRPSGFWNGGYRCHCAH